MKATKLNILLLVVFVITIVLNLMTQVDYSQPNYEFLPDMKYSPAYEAFADNVNFPNGRTLQSPPPNTIAQGHMPLPYKATPEDAVLAGKQLTNPIAADKQSLQRGAEVFQINCVVCHGPTGLGDGTVTKKGYPPPPSLLQGNSLDMKDGQLFHIITFGQANMKPYGSQVPRQDRWHAINYVRSMQAKAQTPETAPATETAAEKNINQPVPDGKSTESQNHDLQ